HARTQILDARIGGRGAVAALRPEQRRLGIARLLELERAGLERELRALAGLAQQAPERALQLVDARARAGAALQLDQRFERAASAGARGAGACGGRGGRAGGWRGPPGAPPTSRRSGRS